MNLGVKDLKSVDLLGKTSLHAGASLLPPGFTISGTMSLKTKPLNGSLDKLMTIQYVILGYADLVTDIMMIIELILIGDLRSKPPLFHVVPAPQAVPVPPSQLIMLSIVTGTFLSISS